MSEPKQDGILARIRKILIRTEQSGCTPAEAEAAFAMASRIMTEHNLTMDSIKADEKGEDSFIQEDVEELSRWTLENNLCYGILKNFYFVDCVLDSTGKRKTFRVFGTPENVAVARFIWSALQASFERCWLMYKYLHKKPSNERRLFISGMAKGFSDKLRAEREAQKIERDLLKGNSGSTGLALVSIESKLQAAFKAHNSKAVPRRGTFSAVDGSKATLEAGIEAGRKLNLNRAVEGKGRKAIS